MRILVLMLGVALGLALAACGRGGAGEKAAPAPPPAELAKTAAQELALPPSVEEALKDIYLRLGLEEVTVSYRDGEVRVAFEQPDLPAGHVQVVYLLVLDVAALNAPFSQQVVMTVKIDGQPLAAVAGQTEDIRAFRLGELTQQEYFARLIYSLGSR